MATLSVNVDHVATVRQARLATEPDPVAAALIAEMAGADGITVHLREDRRHIQDRDVRVLREVAKTELNLEMAATSEMADIALKIKPDLVTIVPEKRRELTTEGGLDVKGHMEALKRYVGHLMDAGIPVNLFIDPSVEAVKDAHRIGPAGVEIHTGTYAESTGKDARAAELRKVTDAVMLAKKLGMRAHAGHGLDYRNIRPLLEVPEIDEFAIGYGIIARSIFVGIEQAVFEMVSLVRG